MYYLTPDLHKCKNKPYKSLTVVNSQTIIFFIVEFADESTASTTNSDTFSADEFIALKTYRTSF